ncbi:DNA-directed RNA polymerase subunit delta [Ornithinibacillus sp. 16A2E]|uniref:Probable DNA-directed RNA polymerase subunit delta n=2 Tax=Ornithinibacillus xuwenensis TaxID=3144668 RepID=A0ABU9XG73_9BACI
MSLDNLSREEIKSMSMLELAKEIMTEEKKALDFRDVFNKIAELKDFTDEQKDDALAQFYTDLNVDGRFITLGSNMWGLKRWYPVEQMDEDIHNEPKKKKKVKKKTEDDDLDIEEDDLDLGLDDEDEEELDVDFDELDDDEDEDFDELEDDDFDGFDDDDEDEDVEDDLDDLNEIDEDEMDDDLEEEK